MKWLKRLFYFLFYRTLFNRATQISVIRKDRLRRVHEAISYINKWQDVPLSWLYGSVCDILDVADNEYARKFILQLTMSIETGLAEEMAHELPYHEP